MPEITAQLMVALSGLGLGLIIGVTGRWTRYCTFCAVRDLATTGGTARLKTWALAAAVALASVQSLKAAGLVDLGQSIYLAGSFGWGGALIGGTIFGIGMALTGSCGFSLVIRAGAGDLKAIVALIVMGLSAYMAARGLTGLMRAELIAPLASDPADIGGNSLAGLVGHVTGLDSDRLWLPIGLTLAAGLAVWALRDGAVRTRPHLLVAAVVFGLAAAGGFFATGYLGHDDFDPVRLESVSYIMPAGNAIIYLVTFTGASINFGIALLFGTLAGSALTALARRDFAAQTFADTPETVRILAGAFLMGFGGVTALGCTIGQGITGVSTLSMPSFIAVAAIVASSWLVVRRGIAAPDGDPLAIPA